MIRVPGRYLAYKSVVNVLNENGFALFNTSRGLIWMSPVWEAILTEGPPVIGSSSKQ